MSREVIVIGGLASKVANLAPFRLLGSLLSNSGNPYYINGGYLLNGELQASTPSKQIEETDAIVAANPDTRYLIVSHSIGAIAAVETVKKYTNRTQAVIISPPLPSPSQSHSHSRIQARIHSCGGKNRIPSYSFALGDNGPSDSAPAPVEVTIPGGYSADVSKYSAGFSEDVMNLATSGQLQLVISSRDWNADALMATRAMPGVIHIDGTHSLQAAPEEMSKICNFIVNNIYSETS